ncbi:MAG: hypothetical protein A2046_07900 [Bacteroidetes bacterium GWA2_30_7]|nr:MAG: hypothetical protein A2046_07900 [Bacteroidetes bacterium GWA2_30_7]
MKYILLTITILLFISDLTFAQDGKALFERNCKACHSIGGGKKVGPDLKGITQKRNLDWLIKFVKSSKDLIASGDADAVAIFEEFGKTPMPSHSMSTTEIQSIFDYIAKGVDAGSGTSTAKTDSMPAIFTASADIGRNIFTGAQPLQNGGPSCISCHSVKDSKVSNCGTYAKDLSVSYVNGVVESMLGSMPAMISSYQNRELTFQEKSHLELYLKTVKENQLFSHTEQAGTMFLVYGILTFIFIILIINIFWRHTKKFGVKDEIYERQVGRRS